MNFDTNTLKKRKPIWIALSDLFLDTELQPHDLPFIAKQMKLSGYSLDEITDILTYEVFPICIPNLHSVAGEWVGFNEDWLVEKILNAKSPNAFQRWRYKRNFWMIKAEWEQVIAL